jgi:hypothetical protein
VSLRQKSTFKMYVTRTTHKGLCTVVEYETLLRQFFIIWNKKYGDHKKIYFNFHKKTVTTRSVYIPLFGDLSYKFRPVMAIIGFF